MKGKAVRNVSIIKYATNISNGINIMEYTDMTKNFSKVDEGSIANE
jgi:hypothetical protein